MEIFIWYRLVQKRQMCETNSSNQTSAVRRDCVQCYAGKVKRTRCEEEWETKTKCEILEDKTKVSTNVISVEFTGNAPDGDYFTKNRDSIISDRLPKKNRTTNPINLSEKVIDYLERTLGVTIAIDDSLDSGEAMVKGGMILMNRNDFNGDDFLKLTVHELSHIVLAYIKLKNPD